MGLERPADVFSRLTRSWRERLAQAVHRNAPGLSAGDISLTVQRILSRFVFLRLCQDRGLTVPLRGGAGDLLTGLRRADAFFNAGLFSLLDDALPPNDEALRAVITGLHGPDRLLLDSSALDVIYEQSLRESVTINAYGATQLTGTPEARESGGVVPTPRHIACAIVRRALSPSVAGKSPAELETFTVADICCGSGIFPLTVFHFLSNHYLAWHQANDPAGRALHKTGRLAFEEKRRILLTHIRGVDIDANAVEAAQLMLFLALLENESAADLHDFVNRTGSSVLPDLSGILHVGDSLISPSEWTAQPRLTKKLTPFSFADAFPAEQARGGFDVIVGNPPYIRIQTMRTSRPAEADFFRSSLYQTARQDSFDAYALFIERSLSLVRPSGRLGFIIPHKFMTTKAGQALRRLVTAHHALEEIVHFGALQVFERQAATYTCLLILDRRGCSDVRVERVRDLKSWRSGTPGSRTVMPSIELADAPWRFADADTRSLFARVRTICARNLGHAAEIFVGVQTSADPVYIFHAVSETAATATLSWSNRNWPIERGILRPCLHDAKLSPYARATANAWMIFPYEIVRAKARLLQPLEMARRFPLCLAYLTARRSELDRRAISGGQAADQQFYQFGRSQNLTKFDSPKIILPVLSLEARYAYDDTNIIMTGGGNGPYCLIRPFSGAPETPFFLLAVLHHPLCEAIIRTHTSAFRGGYYSHGKQFIKGLPIPPATPRERTDIETLVAQLIDTSDAARPALRDAVETRVSELFGLSPDDVALAKATPLPA